MVRWEYHRSNHSKGITTGLQNFRKPPFSPPTKTFPIVWPILYLLMGVSYLITTKNKKRQLELK